MSSPTPLHQHLIRYVDRLTGHLFPAYINRVTGHGVNHPSGIPIQVEWDPDTEAWYQVDDREWFYDQLREEWLEIETFEIAVKPPQPVPFVRVQPKRKLSKRKRAK